VGLGSVSVDSVCLRDTTTMHGVMCKVYCWGLDRAGVRGHTCANKQDCNSNNDPIFSPTHFQSVKSPIPRVLSGLIRMGLTWIYAPSLVLCFFILTHCLDPHHGDNETNI